MTPLLRVLVSTHLAVCCTLHPVINYQASCYNLMVFCLRGVCATLQENCCIQTMITAANTIAFTGGFGMYLTGMGYRSYLNLGGVPRGEPGYKEEEVYDPTLSRTIPYLLLISLTGIFVLTSLRKLMIIDWKLPFPSGTATGIMLESFHQMVRGEQCLV